MSYLKFIFFSSALVLFLGCKTKEKDQTNSEIPPPNVLFILVDDYGIMDLSFMGSTYYETPNIDKLAKKSTVFTQGYANSRVCSPSRASIMTGQNTARHGVTDWIGAKTGEDWRTTNRHDKMLPAEYNHHLNPKDTMLAEAFQQHGYTTFFAGKWHLGEKGYYPENHGFNINVGGWESGSPRGRYFSPYQNPNLENNKDAERLSNRLPKETVNL